MVKGKHPSNPSGEDGAAEGLLGLLPTEAALISSGLGLCAHPDVCLFGPWLFLSFLLFSG